MRYINTSTGSVIDVKCRVSGGDWMPAEKPHTAQKREAALRKTAKSGQTAGKAAVNPSAAPDGDAK